jgi:hypothetical protein
MEDTRVSLVWCEVGPQVETVGTEHATRPVIDSHGLDPTATKRVLDGASSIQALFSTWV